jgi:AraC family transcriptional regulator of adaptative response/methylated-DNA-[protein]-cysteine methyltransferase
MLTEDIMYDALLRKDAGYNGLFIVGVKTTGIFCRPTCTARKPKRENVEFFNTPKEAVQHGYRACKVCDPMTMPESTPEYIRDILQALSAQPGVRMRDGDLRKRGIEPATLRRWFKKHHGVTFHAYQRMNRINHAFAKIAEGDSVSSVAYASGYDSLSGFTETYKTIVGSSPKQSKDALVITVMRLDTPLGPMFAGATDKGLCLLEFTDRRMLETEFKELSKKLKAVIILGEHPYLQQVKKELDEYFNGQRKNFDVPLFTPGTDFQNAVWKALRNIPYGSTRSYKQQSLSINAPDAIRAVAQANGLNRIAIIIPCHRVIGSDGKLTGYGGGLWRK